MAKRKNDEVISTALLDESKYIPKKGLQQKKKAVVKPSFAAVAPIVDVSNNEFFEMASGEFMEILQIESKDTYSLNASDLNNDVNNLAELFIFISDDIKIVPLNMNMQLETQKRFFIRKINFCKNPLHKKFLELRLAEFEKIEKYRTNREYFMFVYHKDEQKLKQKISNIKSKLSRSNPVNSLTLDKKINILFQMANPCTKPIVD